MATNGRLPSSDLLSIPGSSPRSGGKPLLRKDAAWAWRAMDAEARRRFGVSMAIHESSIRRAYRELDAQWRAWRQFGAGRAARPGTSNHGWGLAVDLMNWSQRRVIDSIGRKYGYSKAWSDAQHEWWHIKWRPGSYTAVSTYKRAQQRDPLWFLTAEERKVYREWADLKRRNRNRARRGVLWRWMIERRKNIWRAAQKSGWGKFNRARRYKFFNDLTT